jgi:predicted nucleotidyltransferase
MTMTEAETLHEQARVLRELATRFQADDIKELLRHLAEQCEALAKRLERQPC